MKNILLLLSLGVLMWGCSAKNELSHEEDCNKKFESIHSKFLKEKYTSAKEAYSEFVTTCNATQFAEQAQFELAESYFHLKSWEMATAEYEDFLRVHPSSEFAEMSSYKLAVSVSEQIYSLDRDQSKTLRAIDKFEEFMGSFPTSKLQDSAKVRQDKLYKQLAKKELKIAHLYTKLKAPQAAAIYYKSSLKNYGDFLDKKEIYLRLAECYLTLNQLGEVENYLKEAGEITKGSSHFNLSEKIKKKLKEKKKVPDPKKPS